mmetsp:Transcript_26796/g.81094  ORF Transcript_26796/g.81094 Transcript_26796/m.81094 type:complete len:102 (+) Transcript_26796:1312-1617(+)|eukprot:scaffold159212_cov28-Tisochrysis_lutea.AAC.2
MVASSWPCSPSSLPCSPLILCANGAWRDIPASAPPSQVQATRELVAAVWPLFTSGRSISRQAFLQPGDGLADTLIAQLDLSKRDSPPQAVRVTAVASYPQI